MEVPSNAVAECIRSLTITRWVNIGVAISVLKYTPTPILHAHWVNPLKLKNAIKSALVDQLGAKEAAKPKSMVHFLVTWEPFMLLTLPYMHTGAQREKEGGKGY